MLKNKGKVSSSGDTHNTDEEMSQESKFSKNGQLQQSKINSTTNFNSEYEEPNENYSTYNFDFEFQSEQEANLEVV